MKKKINWTNIFFIILTIIFILYLVVPFSATIFFSFAGKWTDTILPESWTLNYYKSIFNNIEFYQSLGRTLILATVTAVLQVFITILAILGVKIGSPKMDTLIEVLSIIPIALPGVVLALGNVKLFGIIFPSILGTPFLVCCVQIAFGFPFSYRTVTNAFRAFETLELYNAAKILGCGIWKFIFKIVIPSIKQGIIISFAMSFATVVDCFAIQQLIVGAGWQTYASYEYKYMKIDGHISSGLIAINLIIIFIVSLISGLANKNKRKSDLL